MIDLLLSAAFAAEPDWHQLYVPRATASSFLRSNWNKFDENYHPNFAFDEDPATAWVEGVDGDGVGQVLSWDVSALSSARAVKLRIRNGYQKSADLLRANGAPARVAVSAWKGREVVARQEFDLATTEGWQDLVVSTGGRGLSHLELEVVAVRAGSKYADTCISDIETFVDSDTTYDAAFERGRLTELQGWIAERVEAAKSGAAAAASWPFLSNRWEATSDDITVAQVEAEAAPLRAVAPALARLPLQRPAGKSVALPDGPDTWLRELGLAPFLRGSDLTVFESTEHVVKRVTEPCDGECWYETRDLRIEKAADGRRPSRGSFVLATHEEARSLTTSTLQVSMVWDEAGRLTRVLAEGKGTDDMENEGRESHLIRVFQLDWEGDRLKQMSIHASNVAEGRDPWTWNTRWTAQR